MNFFKSASFVIAIIAVIAAFFVYPLLPAVVPTHWGVGGQADGFGASWIGAFLFPLIMVFTLLLFALIPRIMVFKKNFKSFEKQYWAFAFFMQLFFIVFYALTLVPNFGFEFNMSIFVSLLVAVLFIVIGILMPSFKRNFFIGIKTPWTLSSDKVWDKTHKLGGKLFIASGIIAFIGLLAPDYTILIMIVPVLVSVVIVFLYSFLLFRKTEKQQL